MSKKKKKSKMVILIRRVPTRLDRIVSNFEGEEEALEHFDFNVSGSYVGELTPIWCDDTI
jgi:hypothetical protein